MYNVRKVTDDLYWVGANDHRTTLFENIHPIPKGVSYNAYLLLDKETVLFDTVDWSVSRQMMENLEYLLGDRPLDWLVINHLEPDHAASIDLILARWPKVKIISTEKGFMLMRQFGFHPDGTYLLQGDTVSYQVYCVDANDHDTIDAHVGILNQFRSSKQAIQAWAELKKAWAEQFSNDPQGYEDAKKAYFEQISPAAREKTRHDQKLGSSLAIGMCLGCGVGMCFGVALNNIGVGMCIGMSIGMCLGLALGRSNDKTDKKQ